MRILQNIETLPTDVYRTIYVHIDVGVDVDIVDTV